MSFQEAGDETLADSKGLEPDGSRGFHVKAADPTPEPSKPGPGKAGPHVKLQKGTGREYHLHSGSTWHGQSAGIPNTDHV